LGSNSRPPEECLTALKSENARLAAELEGMRARFTGIVELSDDAIISLDHSQRITLFNKGAERIFGYRAEEVLGQPIDILLPARFVEIHRNHVAAFEHSPDVLRPMAERGEIYGRRKDGSEFPAEASISKFQVAGEPVLNVRLRDITERRRFREELNARARQQAALADLGLEALRGMELPALMQRVCEVVAETLGVEYAKILELLPGGKKLLLAAGVGWREGLVGTFEVSAGGGSHGGYTLASTGPVVIEDLRTETRFSEPLLSEHGVVSGLAVIIYAQGHPFGVLGAHTTRRREFTDYDISFLQVAANVLGAAIERQRAEETLRVINQTSPLAILATDLEGRVKFWNPAAERLFGWTEAEVLDRPLPTVPPGESGELQDLLERTRKGERLAGFEARRRNKKGDLIDVEIWSEPLRDAGGKITGILSILLDVTERNRMEEQYRQTQKLESVGVLAGGIAHDFNNLLTGIIGNISMAADAIPAASEAHRMLENALRAGDRAAELIRQLLAYAGKGRFVLEPVDLSETVHDLLALIETSVLKRVRLRLDLAPGLPPVEADPSQMQQLVMNLVINAAEAIGEDSGTVEIRTRQQDVTPEFAAANGYDDLAPGRYVALEVCDTGSGMDEAIQSRIFEPFFTTKFTGRGLGLAAVSGIVRGHKGAIKVKSKPGRGSTFEVLLPASPRVDQARAAGPSPAGTVLVVDDEEIVRQIATLALSNSGFHVLTAENGFEALRLLRKKSGEISVVLLDMSMPLMSGERALREMRRIRPDLRVVVSSGYGEAEAARRFAGLEVSGFLQKPYTASQLVDRIKDVTADAGRKA
jgi:two-component system cell cycle sensor histidine kinase/response regulator CckA